MSAPAGNEEQPRAYVIRPIAATEAQTTWTPEENALFRRKIVAMMIGNLMEW